MPGQPAQPARWRSRWSADRSASPATVYDRLPLDTLMGGGGARRGAASGWLMADPDGIEERPLPGEGPAAPAPSSSAAHGSPAHDSNRVHAGLKRTRARPRAPPIRVPL